MQDLVKQKHEMDELYNAAMKAEVSVHMAAQTTIDGALQDLTNVLVDVIDEVGAFRCTAFNMISLCKQGTPRTMMTNLVLHGHNGYYMSYHRRKDGSWVTVDSPTVSDEMAIAETIMAYWPKFKENLKEELSRQLRNDMHVKRDKVNAMLEFLQKAEKFVF